MASLMTTGTHTHTSTPVCNDQIKPNTNWNIVQMSTPEQNPPCAPVLRASALLRPFSCQFWLHISYDQYKNLSQNRHIFFWLVQRSDRAAFAALNAAAWVAAGAGGCCRRALRVTRACACCIRVFERKKWPKVKKPSSSSSSSSRTLWVFPFACLLRGAEVIYCKNYSKASWYQTKNTLLLFKNRHFQ